MFQNLFGFLSEKSKNPLGSIDGFFFFFFVPFPGFNCSKEYFAIHFYPPKRLLLLAFPGALSETGNLSWEVLWKHWIISLISVLDGMEFFP